jgi:hypothetical protein
MSFWTSQTNAGALNADYVGQLHLALRSCADISSEMGWPLLLVAVLGIGHGLSRFPRRTIFLVLPLVAFYVIVITQVRYSQARFYLPGLPGLLALAGKSLADLTRARRVTRPVSMAVTAIVLAISLAYCSAAILEMRFDTRRRAERWFIEHVPPQTEVAALASPNMSPQLAPYGMYYRRLSSDERKANVLALLASLPSRPSYLILVNPPSGYEPAFLQALKDGTLGYRAVATFERIYLGPHGHFLDLAGWPAYESHFISPKVVVLQKQ